MGRYERKAERSDVVSIDVLPGPSGQISGPVAVWPAGLYMLDRAAELEFPGIGGQYFNPEEGLMDVHEDNGQARSQPVRIHQGAPQQA